MTQKMTFGDYLEWLTRNLDFLESKKRKREIFHPGKILEQDFLLPQKMSQSALARKLHCSHAKVNEIIKGKRGVSPEFALMLERIFGVNAEFWISLQGSYDIARAREKQTSL